MFIQKEYLQTLKNIVRPSDELKIKGDVRDVADLTHRTIPAIKGLIAHAKVEFLKDKLRRSEAGCEKVLRILETTRNLPLALRNYAEAQNLL